MIVFRKILRAYEMNDHKVKKHIVLFEAFGFCNENTVMSKQE